MTVPYQYPAGVPGQVPGYAPAAVPIAAPAAVPTPATAPSVAPAMAPAQATPQIPVALMPPVPAAAPGMSPMDMLRKQVSEASVSEQRKNLPEGTAIFVINAMTRKLSLQKMDYDVMTLICIQPITDVNGLRHGDQGYAGPIPGSSYEYPIFINPKYNGHVRQWLDLVKCFQNWDADTLKAYQASPEGLDQLMPLIQYYIGFDFATNKPMASVLANMNCAEVNTAITRKQGRAADGKTLLFDQAGQPIMKEYTNTYFNRHVPIAEVWQAVGQNPEFVYRCFGGKENFERAYAFQNPQQ